MSVAQQVFSVVVQERQSVRDIAEEYLGDPNLWQEVLRASGIDNPSAVRPGTRLRIPSTEVTRANRALVEARAAIQAATQAGARVFAAQQIDEAIDHQNTALSARSRSDWGTSYDRATAARDEAQAAQRRSEQARNASGEAVLTDRRGTVQGRKPNEAVWGNRARQAILVENERLRTLSRATAEIQFRDESRLRLGANAQAVIQQMKVDRLTNREEATVSLVEGDLEALLGGGGNNVDVNVAGVDTEIASDNFFVSQNDGLASFANYDDGAIEIRSAGETVRLGVNQGTRVRRGQRPEEVRTLLPAPALAAPADGAVLRAARVDLAWEPLEQARRYWVEVAEDPQFKRIVRSSQSNATTLGNLDLPTGVYYWRVAAVDAAGLPGRKSSMQGFTQKHDTVDPYLLLTPPAPVVRQANLTLRGEVEVGATVQLNGAAVPVADGGTFTATTTLQAGVNTLRVTATDAAGRRSERSLTVRYQPDERAPLQYDEGLIRENGIFLTTSPGFTLRGRTQPQVAVQVQGEAGRIYRTFANADGAFSVNLPVAATATFTVQVVAASGFVTTDEIRVRVDAEPPVLTIAPPPAATASPTIRVEGRAEGATRLTLNGQSVALAESAFDEGIRLRPGTNTLEWLAYDAAGNVARQAFSVRLDQQAPTLVRRSVSLRTARGGETLTVTILAQDATGLGTAASFELQVGEEVIREVARLDATGGYRATLSLPPDARGTVRLRTVVLEDVLGNRQVVGE